MGCINQSLSLLSWIWPRTNHQRSPHGPIQPSAPHCNIRTRIHRMAKCHERLHISNVGGIEIWWLLWTISWPKWLPKAPICYYIQDETHPVNVDHVPSHMEKTKQYLAQWSRRSQRYNNGRKIQAHIHLQNALYTTYRPRNIFSLQIIWSSWTTALHQATMDGHPQNRRQVPSQNSWLRQWNTIATNWLLLFSQPSCYKYNPSINTHTQILIRRPWFSFSWKHPPINNSTLPILHINHFIKISISPSVKNPHSQPTFSTLVYTIKT